jgi:hypothetical protein
VRSLGLLVVLILAGCPKKGPDAPPPVVATCENVGAAFGAALAESTAQAKTVEPNAEALDRAMVAAVVESCTKDAWSETGRACVADARIDAGDKCHDSITDAQFQALSDRMDSAAAKVSPATCEELEPLINTSLAESVAQAPVEEREALSAKVAAFATAVGTQCAGGWSVEARTCVRDAVRDGQDAGRCARWLEAGQRDAYTQAVTDAFGAPPAP